MYLLKKEDTSMTKQKKLLLVCGIIFAPVLALIALVLRSAALFTDYQATTGYFAKGGTLYNAYLWVCAISILFFLIFSIACRKDIPIPAYRNSLSILFSSSFFLVTLVVSTLSGFLAIPAAPSGLIKFFWVISAINALVSLGYFGLFFRTTETGWQNHGLLGLAPAFFALFTAILFYFDRTTQMNAPAKLLHLAAFLLLACYFLAESRGILGNANRPLYYFLTATTLLFSASASIPNLLYSLTAGTVLVLASIYDFVLLAAALYTLARLFQLLPYEYPSVHRMVQQFLRSTATAAAEQGTAEKADASIAKESEVGKEPTVTNSTKS